VKVLKNMTSDQEKKTRPKAKNKTERLQQKMRENIGRRKASVVKIIEKSSDDR
jgi:hypothetical protein